MQRRLGVTYVCRHLGEIVAHVQYQGDTVIIEKQGKPTAVLISFALFEQFLRRHDAASQVVVDVQQQNQNLELNEDELLGLVDEAVHGEKCPSGAMVIRGDSHNVPPALMRCGAMTFWKVAPNAGASSGY